MDKKITVAVGLAVAIAVVLKYVSSESTGTSKVRGIMAFITRQTVGRKFYVCEKQKN